MGRLIRDKLPQRSPQALHCRDRLCPGAVSHRGGSSWERLNSATTKSHPFNLQQKPHATGSQGSRLENSKQFFRPNLLYPCASLLQAGEETWHHKCLGESLPPSGGRQAPKVQGHCWCDHFRKQRGPCLSDPVTQCAGLKVATSSHSSSQSQWAERAACCVQTSTHCLSTPNNNK